MSSGQSDPELMEATEEVPVSSSNSTSSSVSPEQHWEKFFKETPAPANYTKIIEGVKTFIVEARKRCPSRRIVLVSSGGTTVPLEQLTVRFVDNFSSGTRGAASTEYFLNEEYDVIFLYRQKSLKPFDRHVPSVLDLLELDGDSGVKVKSQEVCQTRKVLQKYIDFKQHYHMVTYETLGDYLWLLRGIASELSAIGVYAMFYLAAAVSDFYIPKEEMPEHKMQSDTKPGISFSLVPKMLEPLTTKWAPLAFTVSFKLETDEELLLPKAKQALAKYHHHVVIANLLTTRKKWVILVEKSGTATRIENPCESKEIEQLIVDSIASKHNDYIIFSK